MSDKKEPLTLEQLKNIADSKSAKMHQATSQLHQIGGDIPIHKKAQLYIDQRNEQEGKPPFSFDSAAVFAITTEIVAMDQAGKSAHVEVLYYQYMNLLPTDPYEAIVVDWLVTEFVRRGMGQLH